MLSARAVYDKYVSGEVRSGGTLEICWRCGREGRLWRAVIVRGWSIACSIGREIRTQTVVQESFEKVSSQNMIQGGVVGVDWL